MELLLSILVWLGLISNGNTYTVAQIRAIEAQNQAAVSTRMTELQQGNHQASNNDSDVVVLGM